jgi:sialic acid synthase SpsE
MSSRPAIRIGGNQIGGGAPCFLAAEVGTTCNGNMKMALELVDAAAAAGLDSIKFQTINPDQLSDKSVTFRYKTKDGWAEENMYNMFKGLVFTQEEWQEIAGYTRSKGLVFFSTVDYYEGVDILEACDAPVHKNGAWDVTYEPLIIKMAQTRKPLMLDLGPATLAHVARYIDLAKQHGTGEVILFHDFHTDVPAEMNMRNIPTLRDAFGVPVGFSAPGRQDDLDMLAIALGADAIEKRMTLDRTASGHYHAISLEPDEMTQWVARIRAAEQALGSRDVRPSQADADGAVRYFRSICTTRPVRRGEVFSRKNLDGKRPGTGIPTSYLAYFWGRPARTDLPVDTLLTWKDV